MAKDRELEYILALKDEATAVWKKFSGSVTKETGDMRSFFSGLGSVIGGAFTIAAAGEFMKTAADAAAEVDGLTQTLKNQGLFTDEVKKSMLEYSEVLKDKTAVDDDEITHVQTLMLAMTGNLDAVHKLTPAVLDLARSTGMSTEAAAKMFSKSIEGAEGLKKLGITIGETSNESERFQKVYEAIEAKFGGRAMAWAEGDAGKMKAMSIALEDVEKSIGKVLNGAIVPLIPSVTAAIKLFSELPQPLMTATVVVGGLTAAILLLNASLLLNPYTWIALGIAGIGVAALTAASNFKELNTEFSNFGINLTQTGIGQTLLVMAVAMGKFGKSTKDTQLEISKGTADIKRDLSSIIIDTRPTSEKLKGLKTELESLSVGSAAYALKMREIVTVENQIEVATERAKLAVKGFSGVTESDTFFVTQFSKKLTILKNDISETISAAGKDIKKIFGGGVDTSAERDQAEILADVRLKLFKTEKAKELFLLDEWQKKAVEMAHGNEDLITQIKDVASEERLRISENEFNTMNQNMEEYRSVAMNVFQALGSALGESLAGQDVNARQILKGIINMFLSMAEAAMFASSAIAAAKSIATFWTSMAADGPLLLAGFAAIETAKAFVSKFHSGGTMGEYAERIPLASDERPAILRVGETIRTVEQEKKLQQSVPASNAGTTVVNNFHFNGNIADKGAFKRIVEDGMRELGITNVAEYFKNNSSSLAIA